jgi:aminopeptidase-like protein
MYRLAEELWPIPRSITGDGVRRTLARLKADIPLDIHEVPTGTQVFDWSVPQEWNIEDAYIADSTGRRVVDFRKHNLHVVGYSEPIDAVVELGELKEHLHTLEDHPDWIPYRTSYYKRTWGFCVDHRTYSSLSDDSYRVVIDSRLGDGSLTYGECFLPGREDDEVLISCHVCHPSLANDNLSGIAVASTLAAVLSESAHRLSYRFLFIPGTIGAITWLSLNAARAGRIKHGLVVTCVGDAGGFTYKRSRRGNAEIDRAVEHVLRHGPALYEIRDFVPFGYDERQYCSPGFDLPVGSLTRTRNGEYPEYHTSADNLSLITSDALAGSLDVYRAVVDVLEHNTNYLNLSPMGEPQLGSRGLYPATGGGPASDEVMAMLWALNLSDGKHSLLDIAERAQLPFDAIKSAAERLAAAELLAPAAR